MIFPASPEMGPRPRTSTVTPLWMRSLTGGLKFERITPQAVDGLGGDGVALHDVGIVRGVPLAAPALGVTLERQRLRQFSAT